MLHRPRRTALAALLLSLSAACASGDGSGRAAAEQAPPPSPTPSASPSPSPSPPPPPPPLPRGGRTVFPQHMVVMAYGTARTGALGVLGEGTPQEAAARLAERAAPWGPASGRPVLPAFELITSVAQRSAGPDGDYSSLVDPAEVQRYLAAARAAKMLVVLDFQPGSADVLSQIKQYESFLKQPEVGVAIDPEWVLQPGQLPGKQIGALDAATINEVSAYLSELTTRNRLPEKIFLLHQFRQFMLPDREAIVDRPGLALVFHADGFGPRQSKRETYGLLSSKDGVVPGGQVTNGFKLFLDEDTDLMGPADVMAITPRPELVSYQ